ncbi:sugar phosphate isomerase/epimerase [Kocuria coralli]|uniref:Sugar phosphate isomerase/epimerase n=2 Tax=Kocuria coralli TaxID=1461025 RepID=A0A5J5L0R8_9MICC|nr:sugar phosphate isomerase/epimerase [Kocuria coralli]
MTSAIRRFGLAPLSFLGTPPDDVVRIAAGAGFDFVGLRVIPVTAQEPDFSLLPGTRRLRQAQAALADTGLPVADIEFLALDGTVDRGTWLPVLEAGGILGASSLTVAGCDPDRERLADTLMELSGDCREHGIRLSLEPISYQPVHSIPEAAALAAGAQCDWLPDSLHIHRFGGTAAQLAEHAANVPMLQLCDGPAEAPADHEGLVVESRSRRLVPGAGDFDLASLVQALPEDTDLSAEVPDPRRRQHLGDRTWAGLLLDGLKAVDALARAHVG